MGLSRCNRIFFNSGGLGNRPLRGDAIPPLLDPGHPQVKRRAQKTGPPMFGNGLPDEARKGINKLYLDSTDMPKFNVY
jgi:hypothetical protein